MFVSLRLETVNGLPQSVVPVQEVGRGHDDWDPLAALQRYDAVHAPLTAAQVPGVILLHSTLSDVGTVTVVVRVGEAEHRGWRGESQRVDPIDVHLALAGEPDGPAQLVIEQPERVLLCNPRAEGQAISSYDIVTHSGHPTPVSIRGRSKVWPPTIRQSEGTRHTAEY